MGGKALLLVVMGFSLITMISDKDMNFSSTRTVDNMANYYLDMNAHNIAVSGANMGANQIFLDPTWTAGFNHVSFDGGTINVSVDILDATKNVRRIVSIGTYKDMSDTVLVTLQPSKFSKFAYYSVSEGGTIYWTTGDTVWGPIHTQDYLNVSGTPVFMDKTTSLLGLKSQNGYWQYSGYGWHRTKVWVSTDTPQFVGGFESGVDKPLPSASVSDVQTDALAGGYNFTGHDTVYVTFKDDSISYKYSYNATPTTVLGSSLAPNGIIFATGATLRLQGTVSGRYTVGASSVTSASWPYATIGGNVYLDNDIVYKTDPQVNPNSTDMLGIVSQQNVLVTNNSANNSDINIDASIFCQNGGFGAENYSTRPVSGNINLLGGIQQNVRQAVGTFNSYGITSGFNKRYMYDKRLLYSSPPSYPNTGSFEIVSWYE